MKMTCPECNGHRRLYYIVEPAPFVISDKPDEPVDMAIEKRLEDCRRCLGAGHVTITDRMPVMQEGRKVGTVPPTFDPTNIRTNSIMYDPRPGDFVWQNDHWVASPMLGDGDLGVVSGFAWDREI